MYDPTTDQTTLIAEVKRLYPNAHWETIFNRLKTHYPLLFHDSDRFVVAFHPEIAAGSGLAVSTITALTPSTIAHGGSTFNLLVVGTGFFNGAQIIFDGNPIVPTFIDDSDLIGTVQASWIVTARTVQVSILNADGQSSANQSFVIS